MTESHEPDAATRRDVRNVRLSIWIGVFLGFVHSLFVFHYPLLSMYTVSVIGLFVIVAVAVYAAVVALSPARPG